MSRYCKTTTDDCVLLLPLSSLIVKKLDSLNVNNQILRHQCICMILVFIKSWVGRLLAWLPWSLGSLSGLGENCETGTCTFNAAELYLSAPASERHFSLCNKWGGRAEHICLLYKPARKLAVFFRQWNWIAEPGALCPSLLTTDLGPFWSSPALSC